MQKEKLVACHHWQNTTTRSRQDSCQTHNGQEIVPILHYMFQYISKETNELEGKKWTKEQTR